MDDKLIRYCPSKAVAITCGGALAISNVPGVAVGTGTVTLRDGVRTKSCLTGRERGGTRMTCRGK